MLEIPIFTLRNFTKLPILRYLGICNVLDIWHIWAIPTYRVYRLYDIMVRRSREIISPAWLYGHKREIFFCAFLCLGYGPYIRRSNLANCKFTLVPACINQLAIGGESETELVVSSTTQRPAKNTIKIDVLLTDSDNSGRLKLYFLLTVGRHYVEGTSCHAAV